MSGAQARSLTLGECFTPRTVRESGAKAFGKAGDPSNRVARRYLTEEQAVHSGRMFLREARRASIVSVRANGGSPWNGFCWAF